MARRLAALLIALAVTASGQSPCTAAALAASAPGKGDAAHHSHHASSVHAAGAPGAPCHEAGAELSPRCLCGCTGDLPRAAASAFSAVWALPAPRLAEIGSGDAPAPPERRAQAARPAPSPIDHVPVVA